jgi:hypothetical protein
MRGIYVTDTHASIINCVTDKDFLSRRTPEGRWAVSDIERAADNDELGALLCDHTPEQLARKVLRLWAEIARIRGALMTLDSLLMGQKSAAASALRAIVHDALEEQP